MFYKFLIAFLFLGSSLSFAKDRLANSGETALLCTRGPAGGNALDINRSLLAKEIKIQLSDDETVTFKRAQAITGFSDPSRNLCVVIKQP